MFKELLQMPEKAAGCQDAPTQQESKVLEEVYDGITNNNKDYHTETPTNFHKNSKAGKMACSLERNYRDPLRKNTHAKNPASEGYCAKLYKPNRERQIFICIIECTKEAIKIETLTDTESRLTAIRGEKG